MSTSRPSTTGSPQPVTPSSVESFKKIQRGGTENNAFSVIFTLSSPITMPPLKPFPTRTLDLMPGPFKTASLVVQCTESMGLSIKSPTYSLRNQNDAVD